MNTTTAYRKGRRSSENIRRSWYPMQVRKMQSYTEKNGMAGIPLISKWNKTDRRENTSHFGQTTANDSEKVTILDGSIKSSEPIHPEPCKSMRPPLTTSKQKDRMELGRRT